MRDGGIEAGDVVMRMVTLKCRASPADSKVGRRMTWRAGTPWAETHTSPEEEARAICLVVFLLQLQNASI